MEHEKVCIITQKEVIYTQCTSYKNNETEICKKKIRKNKLRTFEDGNFKTKN